MNHWYHDSQRTNKFINGKVLGVAQCPCLWLISSDMPYNNFKNRNVITPDFFLFSKIYLFHHRNQFHNFKNKSLSGRLQISWCGTIQLYVLSERGSIIASIILVGQNVVISVLRSKYIKTISIQKWYSGECKTIRSQKSSQSQVSTS